MENIKISVVGCGYWGKNLIRNLAALGVLESVCDSNLELAQQHASTYKVPVRTFQDILANKDIAGIVIAAPAAAHAALTEKALNAGKHVFVEKPLALKVDEAKKLVDLAYTQNRVLMVGHLLQYHPAFLELKELIKIGKLGKLHYIYSNRLNFGKFRNEENILWSFAPHDISMILGLVGALPESVYAVGACHLNPSIHDVTTTHLVFKNGIQAHIFVSWLHPFKEQKLVVVGDRGMVSFDDSLDWNEKLKLYPHQVNWINGLPEPRKAEVINIPLEASEPLTMECQHFLDAIQQGTQARTDGEEGLQVLRVLDAAQKSLHQNTAIKLQAEETAFYCHPTAIVDAGCEVGEGTKIWHFSHILKGTTIGKHCVVGQNVMVGPDVIVGNFCKIQNNVSLYKGVTLAEGVFCGPSCVFTNVNNPRAEIERKDEFLRTAVGKGATIGANATIVCGNTLGEYCFIGAGAVVTKDVKAHALMVGNPARQIGWVSHAGEKLDHNLICPREGRRYFLTSEGALEELIEVDLAAQSF